MLQLYTENIKPERDLGVMTLRNESYHKCFFFFFSCETITKRTVVWTDTQECSNVLNQVSESLKD